MTVHLLLSGPGIVGLTVLVIVLGIVAAMIKFAVKRHGAGTTAWRWFSGHTWHGRYYTDAGWFRRGNRVLHPTGHAARWHYLPRAERAGIRTGFTLMTLAALYGLVTAPTLTLVSMAGTAGLGLVWASWRLAVAIRNVRHVRQWVRPLHVALAPRLGLSAAIRPQDWLTVPRGFATRDNTHITMVLPQDFHPSAEASRLLSDIVANKLALEDMSLRFEMVGRPRAIVTTSAPPPSHVGLKTLVPLFEAAEPTKPVMGLGRARAVVVADLEDDSPHILVSSTTGGGKSVLARTLVAQGLHNGDVALFLDVKRISHRWAKGLPNIRYCRDISEIHDALIEVATEIKRRTDVVDNLSDVNGDLPEDADIGARIWIVAEEMNAMIGRLGAYWRKIKEKDDPTVSLAVEAWNEITFMGRQLKINAIGIGQMMTARASGGNEARENFSIRCISPRASVNAWKMLAPEVWPMPKKVKRVGRWQIVTGGAARETQIGFLTPKETREWAESGIVTPFPDLSGRPVRSTANVGPLAGSSQVPQAVSQGNGSVSLTEPTADEPPEDRLVGLREAVDENVISISLTAARWARANDSEFPESKGQRGLEKLYSAHGLIQWEANRERNRKEAS